MISWLFGKTPLSFMVQSLWRDEGFSYLLAKKGVWSIIILTAQDFNPPFYYVLLHYWMKLFGTSEPILRSLSLIFFAIMMYYAFLWLRYVFHITSKKVWTYLLLFTLTPQLLYFAFEARMYSLFALLSIASLYHFLQGHKRRFLVASILGFYTHYFFVFVYVTEMIYVFFIQKNHRIKAYQWILLPLVFALPWYLFVAPTFVKNTGVFWTSTLSWIDISALFTTLLTGYEKGHALATIFAVMVSIALLVYILWFIRRHRETRDILFPLLLWWSVVWCVLIAVISIKKPLFVSRYFIFASVGFSLLLIYMIYHSGTRIRRVILLIFFALMIPYNFAQVALRKKADIRSTIAQIKKLANKDDVILVEDPTLYLMASYYFDESRVYVLFAKDEVPWYIGRVVIPEEKITSAIFARYPTKTFVLKNETSYEVRSIY